MNDRFRFRAWDKECRRMLYNIQEAYDGGCVEDKEGEPVEDYIGVCSFASFFPYEGQEENEYIVEQCTGLKDKNGKLIYEGDIIKIDADILCIDPLFLDEPVVVKWEDLCYFFYLPCIDDAIGHDPCYEYEVIGNIHENPELLEGKEYGKNAL